MRIDGLFELKQAGKKIARPWQIKVKIGAPVQFPRDSDPQWIAAELQKNVKKLNARITSGPYSLWPPVFISLVTFECKLQNNLASE